MEVFVGPQQRLLMAWHSQTWEPLIMREKTGIYIHICICMAVFCGHRADASPALRMVARSDGLPSGLWCIEYFRFANCCDARRPHRH